jgi:hypothetical protein
MTVDFGKAAPAARTPLPWRLGAWIATLAALGALAYVIAFWGWRWLGPEPAPLPRLNTADRLAPAIVAMPLFGRAEAPAAQPADAPGALSGDTRLLGVFAEAAGKGHALFRLGSRGPVLVRSGEEIAKDVTLLEVRPDGVRIRDRGETRDLALRTNVPAVQTAATAMRTATPSRPSPACTPPAGYTGPIYRINAELLTGIAARPEGWTALLGPAPGGGLSVREGSGAASMLGMKPGDSLAQANGIALKGIDDILAAFVKPLIASQQVLVAGLRDGKPAAWLFVNAGACPG